MKYVPVIGLEIHVQLSTKTKMFCRCSTEVFGKSPNSYVCPVCLGLPGALPVTNAEAVRLALLAGEALGSSHPKQSKFDRKNYFYPDLPKGYQISQYDEPFNVGGKVKVGDRFIGITRAHLEEDAGKLLHVQGQTLVDFNRSGLPLLEIVTEPEITSPSEAKATGQKIQLLMRYSGVSEADMEKGSLRIDANISLRPESSKKFGTKVEVKNMNSFRSVEKALEFEIERQGKLLTEGKSIVQETRGWDEGKQITVTQRIKEEAEDYRYFPEPDLPAVLITSELLSEIKNILPEMPEEKSVRFEKTYGLPPQDIEVLISDKELANFFEQALVSYQTVSKINTSKETAKKVANWLITEFLYHMKGGDLSWENLKVTPSHLAELIYLFDQGKVSANSAKTVLAEVFAKGLTPGKIIDEKGLILQSDIVKLKESARDVIAKNPEAVADFRKGKSQAFGFLLGKMMAETSGQADPTIARQALDDALKKTADP